MLRQAGQHGNLSALGGLEGLTVKWWLVVVVAVVVLLRVLMMTNSWNGFTVDP